MSASQVRQRRYPEAVAGSAVLVGLIAAVPVAMVVLVAPVFVLTLAGGAGLGQALASTWITDEEDWELIPVYLLAALVVGASSAVVASLTWSFVAARTPDRPPVARGSAAVAAAAVPLLTLLLDPSWLVAVLPAVVAGTIAFVALPRLGYERPGSRRSSKQSRDASTPVRQA